MDRTLIAVHNMLAAIETSSYDIGVLSERGVLPGLANLTAAKVISRLSLLAGSEVSGRPSAADWRRFGRLTGFTNCKPKYRQSNGLYPYVLLKSWNREQHSMAARLRLEMTNLYQLQQRERLSRIAQHQASYPASRGARYSRLSLERFRNSPKYHDRPAAADIAFCVAAYSLEMPEDAIASTLDTQYLSRDLNPSKRAAYIQRTMAKARSWAQR